MAPIRRDKQGSSTPWLYICCALVLSNFLVYQWSSSGSGDALLKLQEQQRLQRQQDPYVYSSSSKKLAAPADFIDNPLAIPRDQAQNLPSVRTEPKDEVKRSIYGGAGDKQHLGGFTDIDTSGISPRAWKWMVNRLNIQSVLDVGCGRGISTTWFLFHGLRALCVEGSHDARERTMLPDPDTQMVEHDFSRGPWWPGPTFDAVWCVEFLEHVSICGVCLSDLILCWCSHNSFFLLAVSSNM
jgi:hypothetical protein